jgi:4-hydroxy-tetrahydrodipicolinate synthase
MFTGLSAFPLTPLDAGVVDQKAYVRLIRTLAEAKVDSIGALGSTGSYAYLNRDERFQVARIAVDEAGEVPVIVGIGAHHERDVLYLAEDAQKAGAKGLLLPALSYQRLTPDEVYGLYESVSNAASVPIVVYDNPGTTHFEFSDELHARIAALANVCSIKLPGVPAAPADARQRVERLRAIIPSSVTLGVSGDAFAATGLNAGCEVWYSALAGLFPRICLSLTRTALAGEAAEAVLQSERLEPLWSLFRQYGSLRVVASAAEIMGHVQHESLPRPLKGLDPVGCERLSAFLKVSELT